MEREIQHQTYLVPEDFQRADHALAIWDDPRVEGCSIGATVLDYNCRTVRVACRGQAVAITFEFGRQISAYDILFSFKTLTSGEHCFELDGLACAGNRKCKEVRVLRANLNARTVARWRRATGRWRPKGQKRRCGQTC